MMVFGHDIKFKHIHFLFRSKAEITVGARALAKHHHRDQSSSWWGICTGS